MISRFSAAVVAAAFLAIPSHAAAPAKANGVTPQDQQAMVGLIKYLYEGYANGVADRKSYFETVPWDIDTGGIVAKLDKCQTVTGDQVIDFDYPSDSQDPMIQNLSVVYEGSTKPGHATVKATFGRGEGKPVVLHYDMTLYQEAPLARRWGVSNIRIEDADGKQDMLKNLKEILAGDCKTFAKD